MLQQQTAQLSEGVSAPKATEKTGSTEPTRPSSTPFGGFASSCSFITDLFVFILKSISLVLRSARLQQE